MAPKSLCAPNSSTKTRPEITGLTENGKSIQGDQEGLPGNFEFRNWPGRDYAEHQIETDGNRRHQQRSLSPTTPPIGNCREIRADPLGKGLRKHHNQRQHDKNGEEDHRNRDDDNANRLGSVRRSSRAERRGILKLAHLHRSLMRRDSVLRPRLDPIDAKMIRK